MRALGHGLRVGIVQFVKAREDTGEHRFLSRFPESVTIRTLGRGFVRGDTSRHAEAAREAWDAAAAMMGQGGYDLVVLDEINIALAKGLLPVAETVAALASARGVDIVVTGRGAPPEMIAAAELVTEMTEIKHPFHAGVPARRGIEW